MSVEFSDERNPLNREEKLIGSSWMATWLLRKGIVKTDTHATILLILITLCAFAVSAFVLFSSPSIRIIFFG